MVVFLLVVKVAGPLTCLCFYLEIYAEYPTEQAWLFSGEKRIIISKGKLNTVFIKTIESKIVPRVLSHKGLLSTDKSHLSSS